ncbi:MAG: 2OG-Fe(II) oxygenase [Balneola sp.]
MPFYTEEQWIQWLDQLAANDFVVVDNFISDELFGTIMDFFHRMEQDDKLRKAGIGTNEEYQVQSEIRGDFIYWLDSNRDTELSSFFELMDELKESLRRFCFLSLSDSEFHIAKYPVGSHYNRHLDQFSDRSNRMITVLIYLNENWKMGNGGELKMYSREGEQLVEPLARRLLLFKSDVIEHEVLTTNVPRYSLTGWLLHKQAFLGQLLG